MRRYRTGWCRTCNASIIWAKTDQSLMPVDAIPSERGNVLLLDRKNLPPGVEIHRPGSMPGQLRTPHHMTCPQAPQWRRRMA